MTTDRHLAIWHNVRRFDQRPVMGASKTYGSNASDDRLHELHAILHETKDDDDVVLEHEYAYAG